ncbi:creatininase family protein [Thermoflavimicrobium dichotomicum]|uniref:Creatinine amidohydrolase n=1 Tax=Thermoflavimicrobium dichotomicum TaxID=46223 RepID=A0A1I3TH56_9BACL|nr:creatininase family protein [Thermoflavimicrobium dichotomicum]SFJ69843.1 hypothetical protein SAMN05421852_11760 [Thermoflavimicrobium dichotomicum]
MDRLSTWPDLKQVDFGILPIGSIEHGYHLPMAQIVLLLKRLQTN